MNKSIDRIAFEFWAGIGSNIDLENWAESELLKDDPHPDACLLFGLPAEKAKEYALKLAEQITGFSPISEQGEIWSKELLASYCGELLIGKITPYRFCSLIQQFDYSFLGLHEEEEGKIYYPEWLGDLWNQCDWCEESWELSDFPRLAAEAEKVLKSLT